MSESNVNGAVVDAQVESAGILLLKQQAEGDATATADAKRTALEDALTITNSRTAVEADSLATKTAKESAEVDGETIADLK